MENCFEGDEMQDLINKHFDSEKTSDSQIQKYIFEECQRNALIARKSGKKACRYSFLMIRYAIALRLKLGNTRYDFFG